ncbi:hypothetical protein K440DRAFT_640944 [Wilcoxina mikolae CBS 423.85]|nr:hypothetical protein K440DRAFT_640944 [Wilcoxina mikolae CBS 423.85]
MAEAELIDLTGFSPSPPPSRPPEPLPPDIVRVNRTKILQLANEVATSDTELLQQSMTVSANLDLLNLARQRLPIYIDQPPNDPAVMFCAHAAFASTALERWKVALEKKAELLKKLQETLVPPLAVTGRDWEIAARKKGKWRKRRKIADGDKDKDVQLSQPSPPLPKTTPTVRSPHPPSEDPPTVESPSTQLRTEAMESPVIEKASPVSTGKLLPPPPPPQPINPENNTTRGWWAKQLQIGLHEMIPPGSGFIEFGFSPVPRSSKSPLEEEPAKTYQLLERRQPPAPPPSTYISPPQSHKPEVKDSEKPPILARIKPEPPPSTTPLSATSDSRRNTVVMRRSDGKEVIGPFVLDSDSEDDLSPPAKSSRYPDSVPWQLRGKDWNQGPPMRHGPHPGYPF